MAGVPGIHGAHVVVKHRAIVKKAEAEAVTTPDPDVEEAVKEAHMNRPIVITVTILISA